jgi:hypothetical protein
MFRSTGLSEHLAVAVDLNIHEPSEFSTLRGRQFSQEHQLAMQTAFMRIIIVERFPRAIAAELHDWRGLDLLPMSAPDWKCGVTRLQSLLPLGNLHSQAES